ncbi:hypothetical protein RN001_008464 [Aquatica leii]|uniref:Gamma-tubulin complex component n=1 Tax=Aquatica leii TaxID=1421715 RepID=A0AAN7SP89_9COLE|nr:hypothetical protein RN001_008464 [Aquatica leii]
MSESSFEGATISSLINKLCNHYSGNDPEVCARLFKVSSSFLMQQTDTASVDEQRVVNQIQKLLANTSSETVLGFNHLYANLQKSSVLKNKGAVLALFYNLYKESERNNFDLSKSQLSEIDVSKSHLDFLPDDANAGVRKLYAAPSGKFSTYTSGSQINTLSQNASNDYQFQIALKEKSSATVTDSATTLYNSVKEVDLIQEVIYSLQGIEGRILKKEPGDFGFVIDSKAGKSLSVIHKSLLERLSSLGFLHNKLKHDCENSDKQSGVVGQSLIATFREELSEYYKTLAILQEQLRKTDTELTLRRMLVWVAEPKDRLQWLAYIAEQCTNKKGGALISAVYSFSQHGSTSVQKISTKVLLAVCRPLYIMMSHWLLDGEINDPYNEFFIEARNISSTERFWYDKYNIKVPMVPSFISMEQAKKILATGKNINFLRQICKDSNQLPGREALQKLFTATAPDSLFLPDKSIDLHSNLENVYKETSHRVLCMLKDKYMLLEHFQALRRYLLLGQGDFIRHLLELLAPELSKPAQYLYPHTLSAILESAIRVTNAQFEDEEILKRLMVEFLHHSPGDIGWDIFTLVYIVDGPVGTIFEPAMSEYRTLFGSLWKAKRMEYVLSNMRKQQITVAKIFRKMKVLRPILHQIHILSSAMIHFLHQTQYYFLFEVLECSWAVMMKQVSQAECLDDVINAHSTFLNSVQCGVLLDSGSESNRGGFSEMCAQLRIIYNLILQLESTQETLYQTALEEHKTIVQIKKQQKELMLVGKYSLTTEQERENKLRISKFHNNVNLLKHQIKQIDYKYKQFVQKYLNLLVVSPDQNLQLLSVRLNFNDYYKII